MAAISCFPPEARLDNQILPNGDALRHDLKPILVAISELRPLGNQTRRHPQAQIEKLASSLREYGFVLPIVLDPMQRVVAGWALVQAAKLLGLNQVPGVTIVDLSEAQLRLLKLALNRLPEDASWDPEALRLELTELLTIDTQIDLQLTGFSTLWGRGQWDGGSRREDREPWRDLSPR